LKRALAALLVAVGVWLAPRQEDAVQVDAAARAVTVRATLHPIALEDAEPASHHLLTSTTGRAGHKAFLRTAVSDVAVLDALEALGGRAGDTLVEETWTRRQDPAAPEPDLRAEGSALEITVRLPGDRVVDIAELLEDVDERGYAWRLAGNRALIDTWRSGCVVCLQSCPGGRVGNARATIRDHAQGRARFRASALARSLGEGTRVEVTLRLTDG
jgi:hypothetical protein